MNRGRLFGAAALVLACTLSAQQPRVDESIEVSIVNVDVRVTDKDGNPVTGLTAADFEIREEGKLQPISNFAEYAAAATGGVVSIESPSDRATVRPRRTILLFIESARLNAFQAAELFASLRKLVRDVVVPGDRVTIVTWKGAMAVKQPLTDDVALVERVLTEMESNHPRYDMNDAQQVRREQAESDFADAIMGGSSGMPPVHALDAARRQHIQIRQKAAALEALMDSMSALEGRKIIIMAMRRFGVYAGMEFFGGDLPLEQLAEFDTEPFRDAMIRKANAHGITLYPVYPTGLAPRETDDVPAGGVGINSASDLKGSALQNKILFNEATALQDLAAATGGLMAWGTKNIAELLPRVADDLSSYYSLAYRARATGKDVTRKIAVTTKNRAYEVRSRRQFVEKSDESLMNDRVIANLYQPLPGSTLPFDVGLGVPVKDRRNRWTLPLQLRIPIASLTTQQQVAQYAGEFSVYLVTGAAVGAMSEVERRSQPFQIPYADLEKAKSSHYTYKFTLNIDGEVDRLSVGVVDEVAKEFGLKRVALPPKPAK